METENEINNEEINTNLDVPKDVPALPDYTKEIPETSPNVAIPETTPNVVIPETSSDNVNDYTDSLNALVTKYSKL
jgi:hypothetical protein